MPPWKNWMPLAETYVPTPEVAVSAMDPAVEETVDTPVKVNVMGADELDVMVPEATAVSKKARPPVTVRPAPTAAPPESVVIPVTPRVLSIVAAPITSSVLPSATAPVSVEAPEATSAPETDSPAAASESSLVLPKRPMDVVPPELIITSLMSTYLFVPGVVSEIMPAAFVMSESAAVRVSAVAEELAAPPESVARPVTPSVELRDAAPVTTSVLPSVVAPVTPSVLPSVAAPFSVDAPVTASELLSVVAPVTPRVLPTEVAPVSVEVPATVRVTETETPAVVSVSRLVAVDMPTM